MKVYSLPALPRFFDMGKALTDVHVSVIPMYVDSVIEHRTSNIHDTYHKLDRYEPPGIY